MSVFRDGEEIVGRQGVEVFVAGSAEAEANLLRVAKAQNNVSEASIREKLAIEDADKAVVAKIRAEQAHAAAIEQALNPMRAATAELGAGTKSAGVMSQALEAGGKAFGLLARAANIIPGLGMAGIFMGIYEGVKWLASGMSDGVTATDRQTAAFTAQTVAAHNLEKSYRGLRDAQVGASGAGLSQAIARIGPGMTPAARAEVLRLSGLQSDLQQQQAEAISRQARQAAGLVPISDSERKRIDALLSERDKLVGEGEKLDKDGKPVLDRAERLQLRAKAQAFQDQVDEIRKGAHAAAAFADRDLDNATLALSDVAKKLKAYGVGPDAVGSGETPRSVAKAISVDKDQARADAAWNARARSMMDDADAREKERLASFHQVNNAGGFAGTIDLPGQQTPGMVESEVEKKRAAANGAAYNAKIAGDYNASFGKQMDDVWNTQIPDAAAFGAQAIQTAAATIGNAFSSMIIGGDKVRGGLGRMFGEVLASQSSMLFGLAVTAEFLAAAAALMGLPIFGYTAGQAAGAGLVFAAGGAALAVAARQLGAGHSPGGGKRASPGSGAASAASTFGGGMSSGGGNDRPMQLTVVMGGDPIYDGLVKVDQDRRNSGSSSRPLLGAS